MELKKEILYPIVGIDGVKCALIHTKTGEVILKEVKDENCPDANAIASLATEILRLTHKITNLVGLGTANFFRIETNENVWIHKCIIPGKAGIGVVATKDTNIGLIIFYLNKLAEKLKPTFA